jgi:hypothetical protein
MSLQRVDNQTGVLGATLSSSASSVNLGAPWSGATVSGTDSNGVPNYIELILEPPLLGVPSPNFEVLFVSVTHNSQTATVVTISGVLQRNVSGNPNFPFSHAGGATNPALWLSGPTAVGLLADLGNAVHSVVAADGTITVGGTASNPSIAVGTVAQSQVSGLVGALAAKAGLVNPTFTGHPTLSSGLTSSDASLALANKGYVDSAVGSGGGGGSGLVTNELLILPATLDSSAVALSAFGNLADVLNSAFAGGVYDTARLSPGIFYVGLASKRGDAVSINWPGSTDGNGNPLSAAARPFRLYGAGSGKTIVRGSPGGFNPVINMLAQPVSGVGRVRGSLANTYVGGTLQVQGIKDAEVYDMDFDLSTYDSQMFDNGNGVRYGNPGSSLTAGGNTVAPQYPSPMPSGLTNNNFAVIYDPNASNNQATTNPGTAGIGFRAMFENPTTSGVAGGVLGSAVVVNGDFTGENNPQGISGTQANDGSHGGTTGGSTSYWNYGIVAVHGPGNKYMTVFLPNPSGKVSPWYSGTAMNELGGGYGTPPAGTKFWIIPRSTMVIHGYGLSKVSFKRGRWTNTVTRFWSLAGGGNWQLQSPTITSIDASGSGTTWYYAVVSATDYGLNFSSQMAPIPTATSVNTASDPLGTRVHWPYTPGTIQYFVLRATSATGGANGWTCIGVVNNADADVLTDRPEVGFTTFSFVDPGLTAVPDGGHAISGVTSLAGTINKNSPNNVTGPAGSFLATDLGRKVTWSGGRTNQAIIYIADDTHATVAPVTSPYLTTSPFSTSSPEPAGNVDQLYTPSGGQVSAGTALTVGSFFTGISVLPLVQSPFYDNDHVLFEDINFDIHCTGDGTEACTSMQTDYLTIRGGEWNNTSYAGLIAYYFNRHVKIEDLKVYSMTKGNTGGSATAFIFQEPVTEVFMRDVWGDYLTGSLMRINMQSGLDQGKGTNGVAFSRQVETQRLRYTHGGDQGLQIGAVRGYTDHGSYIDGAAQEGIQFANGGNGLLTRYPVTGIVLVGTHVRGCGVTPSACVGGFPAAIVFRRSSNGSIADMNATFIDISITDPTSRTDLGVTVTNGSATVTDTAVTLQDYGLPVSGPGIPAGSKVGNIVAGTSFQIMNSAMSATVTATDSATIVTIGTPTQVDAIHFESTAGTDVWGGLAIVGGMFNIPATGRLIRIDGNGTWAHSQTTTDPRFSQNVRLRGLRNKGTYSGTTNYNVQDVVTDSASPANTWVSIANSNKGNSPAVTGGGSRFWLPISSVGGSPQVLAMGG